MADTLKRGLKIGWGKKFYDHIFCHIDEVSLEVLYYRHIDAPNTPVNVLLVEKNKHFLLKI